MRLRIKRGSCPLSAYLAFKLTNLGQSRAIFLQSGGEHLEIMLAGAPLWNAVYAKAETATAKASASTAKEEIPTDAGIVERAVVRLISGVVPLILNLPEPMLSPLLGKLLRCPKDAWGWAQTTRPQFITQLQADIVAIVIDYADEDDNDGSPEPETAPLSNVLSDSSSDAGRSSPGSALSSLFMQLICIDDWPAQPIAKETISWTIQVAMSVNRIYDVVRCLARHVEERPADEKAVGWLSWFGEGETMWPTKLSVEAPQNYLECEWVVFVSLLAQTAVEAAARRELARQLAASGTLDELIQSTLSDQRYYAPANLDGYLIYSWADAIIELDEGSSLLPLFCQVFMCLYFEHANDARGKHMYLGHRFLSRHKQGHDVLRRALDQQFESCTSRHQGQTAQVLNDIRLWLAQSVDDKSCDRLRTAGGAAWPKTAYELVSVFTERPWEAGMWTPLVGMDGTRKRLLKLVTQRNSHRSAQIETAKTPVPRKQPQVLRGGARFTELQTASLVGDDIVSGIRPALPVQQPYIMMSQLQAAIAKLSSLSLTSWKICDDIAMASAELEELLSAQLYSNDRTTEIVTARCYRDDLVPLSECQGAARIQVRYHRANKVESNWLKIASNASGCMQLMQRLCAANADAGQQLVIAEQIVYWATDHLTSIQTRDVRGLYELGRACLFDVLRQAADPSACSRSLCALVVPNLIRCFLRTDTVQMMEELASEVLERSPESVELIAAPLAASLEVASSAVANSVLRVFARIARDGMQLLGDGHVSRVVLLAQSFDMSKILAAGPSVPAVFETVHTLLISLCWLWSHYPATRDVLEGAGPTEEMKLSQLLYQNLSALAVNKWPAQFEGLIIDLVTCQLTSVSCQLIIRPLDLHAIDRSVFLGSVRKVAHATIFTPADESPDPFVFIYTAASVESLRTLAPWVHAGLSHRHWAGREDEAWEYMMAFFWRWFEPRFWQPTTDPELRSTVLLEFCMAVDILRGQVSPARVMGSVWALYHRLIGAALAEADARDVIPVLQHVQDRFRAIGGWGELLLTGDSLFLVCATVETYTAKIEGPDASKQRNLVMCMHAQFYAAVLAEVDWPAQLPALHGCGGELLSCLLCLLRSHPLPLSRGFVQTIGSVAAAGSHGIWETLSNVGFRRALVHFDPLPMHDEPFLPPDCNTDPARFTLAMALVRGAALLARTKTVPSVGPGLMVRWRCWAEFRFAGFGAGSALCSSRDRALQRWCGECISVVDEFLIDGKPAWLRMLSTFVREESAVHMHGRGALASPELRECRRFWLRWVFWKRWKGALEHLPTAL